MKPLLQRQAERRKAHQAKDPNAKSYDRLPDQIEKELAHRKEVLRYLEKNFPVILESERAKTVEQKVIPTPKKTVLRQVPKLAPLQRTGRISISPTDDSNPTVSLLHGPVHSPSVLSRFLHRVHRSASPPKVQLPSITVVDNPTQTDTIEKLLTSHVQAYHNWAVEMVRRSTSGQQLGQLGRQEKAARKQLLGERKSRIN